MHRFRSDSNVTKPIARATGAHHGIRSQPQGAHQAQQCQPLEQIDC